MSIISFFVPAIFIGFSSFLAFLAVKKGKSKKKALLAQVLSAILVTVACSIITMKVDAASNNSATTMTSASTSGVSDAETESAKAGAFGIGLIAAALAVGLCCIGGGIAVAAAAPAAIAATSENPKAFGKSMIIVALGEAFGVYGVFISFMVLNQLSSLSI